MRVLANARELAAHADELAELAARAVEPNPFYEPWMLLPALDALITRTRLALVLVYAAAPPGSRRLIGFFPLERRRHYRGFPVGSLSLLAYRYCFLRTPLVDRDALREGMDGFLCWFKNRSGACVFEAGCVPGSGTLRRSFDVHARRQSLQIRAYGSYRRALFRPAVDAETYLRRAVNGKHRKEFRRLERRLAEHGRLEYRAAEPGRERAWIQSFLELERAGWKGRNGTAIASSPAGRRFFETAMAAAFARGRLATLGLYLDGRPLALSCKLTAGDGAFAFKIAFDERYRRFSPGALVELEHIERLHDDGEIAWMDSCAADEHFMANRLWLHRRTVETLVVSAGKAGRCAHGYLRLSGWLADLRRSVARKLMSPELRHAIRARLP